ncbi:hypothetical protein ACLKA7_008435 [Drosophila subpalustris]
MSTIILLLMLLLSASSCADLQQDEEELPQEHYDGRSFYFLGTLFRRWRDRWLAFQNPAPLYAGPAYPINGYYNCPPFGCNPAAIEPQPGFYPTYYATPLQQQQQQAQGNSNVYIYQTDQNSGISPYGSGFFGPARQPMPLIPPPPPPPSLQPPPHLPPPPAPMLPPVASSSPQASASGSSSFGFGSGPIPVAVPMPVPSCGPNPLSCALG